MTIYRTEQQFEAEAETIAINVWEISTGNGRDLDDDLWDSHMQNCHAAVANAYIDDISVDDWQAAALAKIQ